MIILAPLLAQSAVAAPAYKVLDAIPGPDGGWDYVQVDAPNNPVLVTRGTSVMAVDLATRAVTPGLAPGLRLHDALPVNSENLVAYDAKRQRAFVSAGGDGALSAVSLAGGKAAIIQTLPTAVGVRTIAIDPRTGRLYSPSAQFGPAPAKAGRAPLLTGSLALLEIGE